MELDIGIDSDRMDRYHGPLMRGGDLGLYLQEYGKIPSEEKEVNVSYIDYGTLLRRMNNSSHRVYIHTHEDAHIDTYIHIHPHITALNSHPAG